MKRAIYSAFLLLLAAGACLGQSEQPSLGDLAKQQHGEKKTVKVFTNDDVATHPSSAASPTQAAATSSAPNPSAPANEAKPEKGKEEHAQKNTPAGKDNPEVAELKQKINSYKSEQEGWKKSAKRYQDLLATETSDFRRQMYQDALQGDQQNVETLQNRIDQAESELTKAEKSSSAHESESQK